jgi:hypothetical protein
MQATTRFHDGITNPVLQEADFVFHNPIAFHPTNGMFNADSDRRDPTIGCFLRRGEFPPTGLFLGLDNDDLSQDESLEAPILIEATPRGQGVTRQLRNAFSMYLALTGMTQEANVTGLIDHKEVFDRVALLLATVILLLVFWICRAMDRSLSTIMPKRGTWARPSSVWSRGGWLTRRRCGQEANLGVLTSDSTLYGEDESNCWHSIGTSQRVVLGLLGWDAVSQRIALSGCIWYPPCP